MGGDHAPKLIVEGALRAVRRGMRPILVGSEQALAVWQGTEVTASDAIGMGEEPSVARRRPDASVRVALRQVAEGSASATVSFGNTGATLVAALAELGMMPGVRRPALAVVLPRADGGSVVLLDAGANVSCRPEHLIGFSRLGLAYARVLGMEMPRVGVLSNGTEDGKGTRLVSETVEGLRGTPGFVGRVEPAEVFSGGCDVVVTDGFTGNILLKTAEATVGLMVAQARRGALGSRVAGWVRGRMASRHPGAVLLGVNGIVVVGHGGANAVEVERALALAEQLAADDLMGTLRRALPAP